MVFAGLIDLRQDLLDVVLVSLHQDGDGLVVCVVSVRKAIEAGHVDTFGAAALEIPADSEMVNPQRMPVESVRLEQVEKRNPVVGLDRDFYGKLA